MKKVLAFIAFEYYYLMYQIPMKLMHRAVNDAERAIAEKAPDDVFRNACRRFNKWAKVVMVCQAKCDYYRDIVET